MSCGICVLTKYGVAIAADSAVTFRDKEAIHNAAKKIFEIKGAPIGIIHTGNGNFMGIPVEIILENFTKDNNIVSKFKSIKECFEYFSNYLIRNIDFFEFDEEIFLFQTADYILDNFKSILDDQLKENNNQNKINLVKKALIQINKLFLSDEEHQEFDKREYIRQNYKKNLTEYLQYQLNNMFNSEDESVVNLLKNNVNFFFDLIVENIHRNDSSREDSVSLCFSGFVQGKAFPEVLNVEIYSIIDKALFYRITFNMQISRDESEAIILPLAQPEIINLFKLNYNGEDRDKIIDIAHQTLEDIKLDIPREMKKAIINNYKKTFKKLFKKYEDAFDEENNAQTFRSIEMLSLNELAEFAESMISLTIMKRKFIIDENAGTVGGPIDVATISRHNGFVWFKNKNI